MNLKGEDLINWFNPATFLCLSQTRTWISNAIWVEVWGGRSFCWHNWLNCWPSLFKLFFSLIKFNHVNQTTIRSQLWWSPFHDSTFKTRGSPGYKFKWMLNLNSVVSTKKIFYNSPSSYVKLSKKYIMKWFLRRKFFNLSCLDLHLFWPNDSFSISEIWNIFTK